MSDLLYLVTDYIFQKLRLSAFLKNKMNEWMNEWTTFLTDNVRDNCYPHIRLLPTHPHLASADFIRLLPVATSADPQIRTFAFYP